jgi:signal transduction histidine kinase
MLDELGLLPALRSYLQGLSDRTGLLVRFRGSTLAEALSADEKTVLYRVAQESLTNVVKHAQASQVNVAIRKMPNAICMEVMDNGRSFQPGPDHSAQSKKRLGLLGMQERIRLVNGRFTIKAEPGRGTTVRVMIPLRAQGVSAPVACAQEGSNVGGRKVRLHPKSARQQC